MGGNFFMDSRFRKKEEKKNVADESIKMKKG